MVELTIDSLAFGGDAVGRDADGRVTFVPGAAPGWMSPGGIFESF